MSKTIYDLFSRELFQEMLDGGYVRLQRSANPQHGPVAILNYTEKAQFSRTWNDVTLNSRGLIFNYDTFEILARPFAKFFNYGELDGDKHEYDLDELVEVTDKLDGSLGILYPIGPGSYRIATRGSFNSEQAVEGSMFWTERYADKFTPPRGWTMMFEIIYPENRIVVDYGGVRELVYLGAVDIESGATMGPYWPTDWLGPRAKVFPARTLAEALSMEPRPGKEGIVVRFVYDDSRVKIKQQDYIDLHKIVTGLNERAIWQRCMDADLTLPPEVSRMATVLEGVPDEFHTWARKVAERLVSDVKEFIQQVRSNFSRLTIQVPGILGANENRKWYAKQMFVEDWNPQLRTGFWLMLDQKHDKLREFAWKLARPAGGKEPDRERD